MNPGKARIHNLGNNVVKQAVHDMGLSGGGGYSLLKRGTSVDWSWHM